MDPQHLAQHSQHSSQRGTAESVSSSQGVRGCPWSLRRFFNVLVEAEGTWRGMCNNEYTSTDSIIYMRWWCAKHLLTRCPPPERLTAERSTLIFIPECPPDYGDSASVKKQSLTRHRCAPGVRSIGDEGHAEQHTIKIRPSRADSTKMRIPRHATPFHHRTMGWIPCLVRYGSRDGSRKRNLFRRNSHQSGRGFLLLSTRDH